jgi:hypothetical protein
MQAHLTYQNSIATKYATVLKGANECPKKLSYPAGLLCQAVGLIKRAKRMARNDDQSLAANKGCSLNRSGRQRCILGRWRMNTQHRRPAGVAHE